MFCNRHDRGRRHNKLLSMTTSWCSDSFPEHHDVQTSSTSHVTFSVRLAEKWHGARYLELSLSTISAILRRADALLMRKKEGDTTIAHGPLQYLSTAKQSSQVHRLVLPLQINWINPVKSSWYKLYRSSTWTTNLPTSIVLKFDFFAYIEYSGVVLELIYLRRFIYSHINSCCRRQKVKCSQIMSFSNRSQRKELSMTREEFTYSQISL